VHSSPALDDLVREHLPAVLRFATRLSGDPDAAEEIVQEALLRAVRGWPSFRGGAGFRTWLWKIVINAFRDRLRTRKLPGVALDGELELVDPRSVEPIDAAMAVELEQRIAMEVSRLPPRQREVLVLTVYEGLSTRSVAEVVGIRETNVHATLSAARAQLRAKLARYFNSSDI